MSKARDLADSVAAGGVLADGAVSLSEVGGGTSNGVVFVNGSGTTTSGSALTFDGSTLDVTGTVVADGLTVSGDVTVNTGAGALTVDAFGGGSVQVSSNGAYKHISTLSSGYHLFEVNSKSVAKFNNGGDISFYEDTGTTPKFFWDASAESLGIGTSSPATTLHISSGGTPTTLRIDSNTEASIYLNDLGGSPKAYKIGTNISSNDGQLEFKDMTANVERMRLDSAGELTTTNGKFNLITVGRGAGAVATNTAVGASALAANTTTSVNTAIGYQALYANTGGGGLTAVGANSLDANTTGLFSVAVGRDSLGANISGSYNVAVGNDALGSNTTASNNTAVGYQAGFSNNTAIDITAVGSQAGYSTVAGGNYLTAVGVHAAYSNTTGEANSAFGRYSLNQNTTGGTLSAFGANSLRANTTGSYNTAMGADALRLNTTASNNTAIGYQAGYNQTTANGNTLIGSGSGYSVTTGLRNTFVGSWNAGVGGAGTNVTTGSANTIIGSYNGNQDLLDIRTSSNNIVLSDGNGASRFVSQGSSSLQLLGGPRGGLSNSLFRVVNRSTGNSSETFTPADMGMSDNITCLINISIGGSADIYHYGGCLIYWIMPRGANSVIHQTIVPAFKGSGIVTFSVATSGNSLLVTKDTNATVSITVIGGGGMGSY
jgi:hypothetical protein